MGTWPRKEIDFDSEEKVKGYGLLVYGGMMALGGGMRAEGRPAFILLSALGAAAFIFGLLTLIRRARQHLRSDRDPGRKGR